MLAGLLAADLTQQPGAYVVDEPDDVNVCGDQPGGAERRNVLTNAFIEIGEEEEVDRGCIFAGVVLNLSVQSLVRVGRHAAVRVVDDRDRVCLEQAVRDDQRAQRVVAGAPGRVSDDVRVTRFQTEDRERVHAGIHAGEHDEPEARLRRQSGVPEPRRVANASG